MQVAAVGFDPAHSQPLLLLSEVTGLHRVLPVWLGVPEASAIELEREGVPTPRPTTHQLIASVVDALDSGLERVCITAVKDSIFHAELVLQGDIRVSARVSDAVALAVALHVPIQAAEPVLEEVGMAEMEIIDCTGEPELTSEHAGEIARFHRLIDDVRPEDFG